MTSLDQRVVAVTGAGRGLGLAITRALLERGASVVANYRSSSSPLEELAVSHPHRLTLVQGDIGEESAARRLVDSASAHGHLDALVHNAAVSRDGLLVQMSVEDWDEVFRVNVRGAFLVTKYAARLMLRRRYGRIVYLSSIVASTGNAGQANYAASKAALHGLASSVAQEYADYNIRTTVLAPGIIDGGLAAALPDVIRKQKLERMLSGSVALDEVAAAIGFLVSADADFFNGALLPMDGGRRF
jgi:3-oxoacyl-[acyl-carrier protein] reductase